MQFDQWKKLANLLFSFRGPNIWSRIGHQKGINKMEEIGQKVKKNKSKKSTSTKCNQIIKKNRKKANQFESVLGLFRWNQQMRFVQFRPHVHSCRTGQWQNGKNCFCVNLMAAASRNGPDLSRHWNKKEREKWINKLKND